MKFEIMCCSLMGAVVGYILCYLVHHTPHPDTHAEKLRQENSLLQVKLASFGVDVGDYLREAEKKRDDPREYYTRSGWLSWLAWIVSALSLIIAPMVAVAAGWW